MTITRTAIIRRALDLATWNRKTVTSKPDMVMGVRMARRELRNGDAGRWVPNRLDALRGQLVRLDCAPWSAEVADARAKVLAQIATIQSIKLAIAA